MNESKLSFAQLTVGLLICILLLSNCDVPTAKLSEQDAANLTNSELCGRYAFSTKINEAVPLLEKELRRRGLSCKSELDRTVGDCSTMQIVSYGPVPAAQGQGRLYTVRNYSSEPRRFRIYQEGISSIEFTIHSNSTQRFGVGISTLTSLIGQSISNGDRPKLYGCQVT